VALAFNRQSNQLIIKQEQAKTSLNQFSSEQGTEREPEQYHGWSQAIFKAFSKLCTGYAEMLADLTVSEAVFLFFFWSRDVVQLLFCFPSSPACFACKACSINLTDLTKNKIQHQDQPQRPLQHSLFKNNNKYPALFLPVVTNKTVVASSSWRFDSPNSMASASSPVISRVFRSYFQ